MDNQEKLFGYGEGFYGPPHQWEDREYLVDFLASHGLNTYVYAPKNDPFHRDRWRDPYPAEELEHFESLVGKGNDSGVNVIYAIAPLGMTLSSPKEMSTLKAKLTPFAAMGAKYLTLLFDDVPEHLAPEDSGAFKNLGEGHRHVAEALAEWASPIQLAVCPVEYTGMHMSPYLEELSELPAEIALAWTGKGVVCAELSGEEIADRSASLGHPLIVWDNFPVNDATMGSWLHVGPWAGRDHKTLEASAGLFLNGMSRPRASAIALGQLGDLVASSEEFVPTESWKRVCREIGGEALAVFAEQCADSICFAQPAPELARLLDEAEAAEGAGANASIRDAIQAELARQFEAISEIREKLEDRRLFDEIKPWVDQMGMNLTAMTAAVNGWAECAPERNGGRFEMEQAFGVIAGVMALSRAATGDKHVHGARFGVRASLETVDGGWRILPDALVTGESQVDRLVKMVFTKMSESH